MDKVKLENSKIIKFFKKFGYYIIASCMVLAIILTLTLVNFNAVIDDEVVDVKTDSMVFTMPLMDATVIKEFSGTELMFNQTLHEYEAHKCVDLASVTSNIVYSVLSGTVLDVYTTFAEGRVIVIQHANNLKTYYGSLEENVDVVIGQIVEKGQSIGKASDSAENEKDLGVHLHFEVHENGIKVDPGKFLDLTEK